MKRLLLGSGGVRTVVRQMLMRDLMRKHFGDVRQVLFVPYALSDHDLYIQRMTELELNAGYELLGIHAFDDPIRAVEQAEAIYVGGGNSFRLIDEFYRQDLVLPIRERVLNGMPYMGVSAGSNVACPTVKTTNDMPIVYPPSFDALGLIPFQINPHYYAGQIHIKRSDNVYVEHFGETRDDRIREYHEVNDAPVIGLWEGSFLQVNGEDVQLHGGAARVFRRDQAPIDLADGAQVDLQLNLRQEASTA